MNLRQATIFIVCFLGLGWSVVAQDCENKTQELCLDLLNRGGLDIKHIDDDLPEWNETASMLNDRCKTFDGFSECMGSVTDHCSIFLQGKYNGWIDAYKYLCKESNKTAVAEYLQCYISKDVASTVKTTCRDIFQSKVNVLLNGSTTVTKEKLNDYCKIADIFFTCLNRTLNDKCGEEEAAWQWTWDRRLNTPILATCPGWSPGSEEDNSGKAMSSWTVALIVILVLITVVMVAAIIFLLIFLFKKRKERSRIRQVRHRIQTTAQPPPPYSAVIYTQSESGAEPQAHLVDSSVALRPSDLGKRNGDTATPTDVVLPPPYIGEQPPAPPYTSLTRESKPNETDGAHEEVTAQQCNETEEEHRHPDEQQ